MAVCVWLSVRAKVEAVSQFWQGLHCVKDWYERGKGHIVGSGKQTRFWKDVWLEECPLKISFSRNFKICHDQDISAERAGSCSWNLSYRRNLMMRFS